MLSRINKDWLEVRAGRGVWEESRDHFRCAGRGWDLGRSRAGPGEDVPAGLGNLQEFRH